MALLGTYGLGVRDVQWIPVGTDVTGRASALQTNRADATLLTAPNYFRLEEAGYKNLANLADHEVYAATTYMFAKSAIAASPRLPEQIIKAHAEAIKRFYDDKAFAVKTYIAYDKQPEADVARIYDLYAKGNIFDRVPYVMDGAVKAIIAQQVDPRLATDLKAFDFQQGDRQRHRRAPGQGRLLPAALRSGHQSRGVAQGWTGLQIRSGSGRTLRRRPGCRSWRSTGSPSATTSSATAGRSWRCPTCRCRWPRASSWPSSDRAAAARPRCSTSSPACCRYDVGDVSIDGARIDGPGVDRAVVFQHSSLLPWRTIAGNVRYGMEMQKRFDRATMRERTEHFIALVGLTGFERHYPSELSGGMQQRVNLARALARIRWCC